MKKRGLTRLLVAVSASTLVAGAYCGTFGPYGAFEEVDNFREYMCVNAPDASVQDLEKCAAQLRGARSLPNVQHLTRRTYWTEALGFALLMDFVLAAFFVGIAWVTRWVARGFSTDLEQFEQAPAQIRVCSSTTGTEVAPDLASSSTGLLFQHHSQHSADSMRLRTDASQIVS